MWGLSVALAIAIVSFVACCWCPGFAKTACSKCATIGVRFLLLTVFLHMLMTILAWLAD